MKVRQNSFTVRWKNQNTWYFVMNKCVAQYWYFGKLKAVTCLIIRQRFPWLLNQSCTYFYEEYFMHYFSVVSELFSPLVEAPS